MNGTPSVSTHVTHVVRQIISEVVQQLSKMFQADVRMIKKQVESLIDREYLKRDEVRALLSLSPA